jgi:hypothetical protein
MDQMGYEMGNKFGHIVRVKIRVIFTQKRVCSHKQIPNIKMDKAEMFFGQKAQLSCVIQLESYLKAGTCTHIHEHTTLMANDLFSALHAHLSTIIPFSQVK